jgi:predicted RNase H-like HicB family nuclease
MLTEFLSAALENAHYELIKDPEPVYGSVPGLQGVWASGPTLEACRKNLSAAVEDWLLFSIHRGDEIPEIGGVRLGIPHRVA